MKARIKSKKECTKIFQIEIPRDVVAKTAEEVYEEIKKIAEIPGFRVGSAPQDLIERYYSKDAKEEVLKRLVPEGYRKAVEQHNVVPVSLPHVFNLNFELGKPLTFEAEVDIRPTTRLRNYKGIKVARKKIAVSQQEIEDAMARLRNVYAQYVDVERSAQKGDYAVCDVEAFVDEKPISKKNQNMWVSVDKDASLLGMGEELLGLSKGQTKEIMRTLPGNYPDKKYAGKHARFNVTVHNVKEKRLPELNDEFARTVHMENIDQLKKEIETQIFAKKENDIKIDMQNQILDKFLKEYKFPIPSSMVKRQKEVLAKRLEMELLRNGVKKEEAQKRVRELDAKLEQDAADKIRIYFILDDIADKEDIRTLPDDTEDRLKAIARSAGQPLEDVKKLYEKENLLGGLSEEIKEGKVLDFLLKEADITETA